jgi:hypothetical protein
MMAVIFVFLSAVGAALYALGAWRESARLDRALRDVRAGEFSKARPVLAAALARGARPAETALALGLCQDAAGETEAAVASWSRVPEASALAPRAALLRARVALRAHRLAQAEPLLGLALGEGGETGREARQSLAHIIKIQGRFDEVVELFQETFHETADPVALLRELFRLRAEPFPAGELAPVIAEAGRIAPGEPGVVLARANLALALGNVDECGRLLEGLESPGALGEAITRARIDWAMAAERSELAAAMLREVPDSGLSPARMLTLLAWLARSEGDTATERSHLESLAAGPAPHSQRALERLAELSVRDGETARVAELRRRKAALDATMPRYHEVLHGQDPMMRAAELARLAEELGWRFEASVWLRQALRREPGSTSMRAALGRVEAPDPLEPVARGALASLRARAIAPPVSETHPRREGLIVPSFLDAAPEMGLVFRFENGRTARRQLPETMSGGVALFDYDGDGWLDVYVVQGGEFPPRGDALSADRLFHNRGGGEFEDVSESLGIASLRGGYGLGVTAGDVNNDGRPDLVITRFGSCALLLNRGGERFEDATREWGLESESGWPSSAALADLDQDGALDLFVCHYARWDPQNPRICRSPEDRAIVYCPPAGLEGEADRLYRNDGGRFVDVTAESGIDDSGARGLGVVAADLDGDGLLDLFVANDMNANLAFRNLGGMRFEEAAAHQGLASNAGGGYLAGMGVACGDLDGDGLVDLAVTNFFGESTRFYHNLGSGQFADHSAAIGLEAPSRYMLGFGAAFADLNNDSHLDLITTNGHVDDLRPRAPYAMPAQLFAGTGGGRLRDVSAAAGAAVSTPRLGRGLAVGDLDNDGLLDVVVVDQGGALACLRNDTRPRGRFLALELVDTASNRDAIGARVEVDAGGRRQVGWRFGGGSYQSSSDPRLHFGLGESNQIDALTVRWPSGQTQTWHGIAADQGLRIVKGQAAIERLPGFQP